MLTRDSLSRCLALQKEYRKDLEQEVKGRGLSGIGLEETPELLRVKNASQILNQVRNTHTHTQSGTSDLTLTCVCVCVCVCVCACVCVWPAEGVPQGSREGDRG